MSLMLNVSLLVDALARLHLPWARQQLRRPQAASS